MLVSFCSTHRQWNLRSAHGDQWKAQGGFRP